MNMKCAVLIFGFLIVLYPLGSALADERITMDLASDHINISTGFTGADVSIFGVKKGPGDVVVTLQGPQKHNVIRRKDNVFGAWINRTWLNFENVFMYYDYAINKPETDAFMSETLRKKHAIGMAALKYEPKNKVRDEAVLRDFQAGLVRNKQDLGLYPEVPEKIIFLSDGFFRADFHLPANVPRGEYRASALLVHQGKIVSEVSKPLKVGQVGLSAKINKYADKNGFLYGLLCVALALFAGWFSNLLVRRNG